MITFYLPDIDRFFRLNIYFIDLLKTHPEYFYPNIQIGSIYGTFTGAIWNGGRVVKGQPNYENVKTMVDAYNSRMVGVRYTWTNPCLQEIHLQNHFCNFIMEQSNSPLNEVIINSAILEEYIRNKYPNISLISSTTKCLLSSKEINEELEKDYKLVVLDFRKNIDFNFLSSITNKNKVEILVNAYCGPDCKSRKEHYKQMGFEQLGLPIEHNKPLQCTIASSFCEAIARPTFIKVNDLYEKYYKELGFSHFKIEGRSLSYSEHLLNYLYYLILPQYHEYVMIDCDKHIL